MDDRQNPTFDAIQNHLNLTVTHATFGRMGALDGVHLLPFQRLYVIGKTPGVDPTDGGHLRLLRTGQTYRLRAGGIYYMPAHEAIAISFAAGLPITGVHFRLELFAGYDLLANRRDLAAVEDRPELAALMPRSAAELGDLAGMVQLRGWLTALVGLFVDLDGDELQRAMALRERYAPIAEALALRPSAALTVGELAETMGLTRDQLSKRFARDTGQPLKHFLSDYLLRVAVERLLASDRPVGEIARELEFSSVHYFSRFVRRHTGKSPTDFRRAPTWTAHMAPIAP